MSDQKHPRVALKIVPTLWPQPVISAPSVQVSSADTVDYICGNCGAVLTHADQGQGHNLIIHCTECESHNWTDQ